ncbi:hypothetical protein [Chryseobacterium sp. RU33C]|nr:hypothetical protein [Chryseobacterium sp. RU33C]SIR48237.1 hypothetical protein SAMN05880573_12416 [Chryseobacterium sp. RU33C]
MKLDWEDWLIPAKKCLDWFISEMGEEEWSRRRMTVADYFQGLKQVTLTEEDIQHGDFAKKFSPIAIYSDWISWYMYLVESIFLRQGCDDPSQSSRIYPFFAVIGGGIELLKKIEGINEKISTILNEKQNMPDSTLFELTIALFYAKKGYKVIFLEERKDQKMPDLKVSKGTEIFFVECKRFGKTTGYAEEERLEWQRRSKHLFNAMRIQKIPSHADVIFKVPLAETDEFLLGRAFTAYVKSNKINDGSILSNHQIDFRAYPLDIDEFNRKLSNAPSRPNSPQMIYDLLGKFDIQGNYTLLAGPSRIDSINPDDKLFVLNDFYGAVHEVYSAQWESISDESINYKAKDIKKILSNAVKQIPDGSKGIIHIAYETVMGNRVEKIRYEKIRKVIDAFDFGEKNIQSVYCHAIQLLTDVDGPNWAETSSFFKNKSFNLSDDMLFDFPETDQTPHWL